MNKTKIICTIGPSCSSTAVLKEMIETGMNVARFNFSHGDHETHKVLIDKVKALSTDLGIPVATLVDTKGPEIRTGITKTGKVNLEAGKNITLVTAEVEGTEERLSISYKQLDKEIEVGKHVLIADGTIDLEVISVGEGEINCEIICGGIIGDRKNVNIPGVKVGLPAITEKDRADILFAIKENVDFIAASFIRKPEDVMEIRKILNDYDSKIHIISKIENEEGVENIDEIIEHSDAIMVARGDLGVQIDVSEIPIIQKRIINKCNICKKPVITATQMLDSMIHNPRPTRAEATDVANAIIDGTDGVMLSGETAGGKYPVEAVKMMKEIASNTEKAPEYKKAMTQKFKVIKEKDTVEDSLCYSATLLADSIDAKAIVTPTLSGNTARLLSRYRLPQPIIAVTTSVKTRNQLLLSSDVFPVLTNLASDTSEMLSSCIKSSLKTGFIHNLDKVVVVAGVPIHSRNTVNLIKVYIIANILVKGKGLKKGRACGKIVKAKDEHDAFQKLSGTGDEILLIPYLDNKVSNFLTNIKGVIIQEICLIPQERLREINPELVVISEVHDAMQRLEDGLIVTIDGEQGLVYEGEIEEYSNTDY